MRSTRLRKWIMLGAAPCLALAAVVPATGSLAATNAGGSGPKSTMIVLLRNQNHGLSAMSAGGQAAIRIEQAPIIAQLHSAGAQHVTSIKLVNAVIAKMTAREAKLLAANPAVKQVLPNRVIPGPAPVAKPVGLPAAVLQSARRGARRAVASPPCGTVASPELDPEALTNIKADQAQALGFDGAGVTVAYLADGVDPNNPDFQRNSAYASPGSLTGSPVVTTADFSSDGNGAPTAGGEAFGDASSIAAQGNQVYDLSTFVNTAHPLPSGCDIKVVGAAPGAKVLGLNVFSSNNDTTEAGFLQAIQYAVASGAKVINESFGANQFPDTSLDVTRLVDDAAVASGVTVVVSSGDAGITSTMGSPATDPNVISAGATTTFRGYAQETYGGINDPTANGAWADNNISSLSSGGYSQYGNTLDLVAPGDLNWALCTPNLSQYHDCFDENGHAASLELFGGTSESSPLTAGAAADVIQAYASTHGNSDPSPALVKQILMSTATDIGAPATEQGAGLLNVLDAVKMAESLPGTSATRQGGVMVQPNQINIRRLPGHSNSSTITVTNTGSSPATVNLSTRVLNNQVADQTGSFCMQPGTPTAGCPAPTGTFPIWSGVTEVYQEVPFTVPATSTPSRLNFVADYQYTGQGSLLHFALLEPDGTYAGYSLPQGLGDYGRVEVANPPAGNWTAVFFTEKNGATPGGVGTSGNIQWDAATYEYGTGGTITPSTLNINAGSSATAHLAVPATMAAGDTSQSVVVSTSGGGTTTIPVTVRTIISNSGGTFSGVLSGGNGRAGAEAETDSYSFGVPHGAKDVEVSVALANDPGDQLLGFLVDPNGQTVGYSSNFTTDNFGKPTATPYVTLFHANPESGRWRLVLQWANPVTGLELTEPFTGTVSFNGVKVKAKLPNGRNLKVGKTYNFHVSVTAPGPAPEAFFVDPRLQASQALTLPDQNAGGDQGMSLPLHPGITFPYYFVPTHTTKLVTSLTGSVPVSYDIEYFPGDPDVSPAVAASHVTESQGGTTASLTLSEEEVSPGFWLLNPAEIGPYTGPAPAATASASFKAVTKAFDPNATSTTGDAWSAFNGLSGGFSPDYVPAGDTGNITFSIKPSGTVGSRVSGTLYVDDYALASTFGATLPNADELAAIHYSYTIG